MPLAARAVGDTTFRAFVTLWVLAFTFHYDRGQPISLLQGLIWVTAIGCLAAPGSVALFAGFLVIASAVTMLDLPAASNHSILALLVHGILASTALVAVRRSTIWIEPAAGFRVRWLDAAQKPVALTLALVYAFAVWHKLNSSFFDPNASCAGVLLAQALRLQGFNATMLPDRLASFTPWLTVGSETAIAIGVVVPKLRRYAVALGALWHGTLAFAHFFDFATYAFALYVLLLPREIASRLKRAETWRRTAIVGWVTYLVFTLAANRTELIPRGGPVTWYTLQMLAWFVAVGSILGPLIVASFQRSAAINRLGHSRLRARWVLVWPALAVANGLTPYLGLKTVSNFSMFSNLLAAEVQRNRATRVADYVTTYLGGSIDPSRAVTIDIEHGQERTGLDLVVHLGQTSIATGIVRQSDGEPARRVVLSVVQAAIGTSASLRGILAADDDGSFATPPLLPGRYRLLARADGRDPQGVAGEALVDLAGVDVTDVMISLGGASLSGRVALGPDVRTRVMPSVHIELRRADVGVLEQTFGWCRYYTDYTSR